MADVHSSPTLPPCHPHPTCTALPGGDEASLLRLMQHSATELLRRLRPDNFGAFAELFTAAVLQVRPYAVPLCVSGWGAVLGGCGPC